MIKRKFKTAIVFVFISVCLAWSCSAGEQAGAKSDFLQISSAAGMPKESAIMQNGIVGVKFDLARGTYDLLDAATGQVVVKQARAEVAEHGTTDRYSRTAKIESISDELGEGKSLLVDCVAKDKPSLILEFRIYDGKSCLAIRGGWKNTAPKPFRVHDFRPLVGGAVFDSGSWSDVRTLTANSACIDPQVLRTPFASCANNMLLTLKRDDRRYSLVLGALKTADFTKWTHTLPEGIATLREAALNEAIPGARIAAYSDSGSYVPRSNCSKLQFTLKQGASHRFSDYYFSRAFASRSDANLFSTVVHHDKFVVMAVERVRANKRYALGFSWWDADSNGRIGSVSAVDGEGKKYPLAVEQTLPAGGEKQGSPHEYACEIPPKAFSNGTLTIEFSNAGATQNIVVSEAWLWECEAGTKIPADWARGRDVARASVSASPGTAVCAVLEALDPVGKLIEPDETYLPEDSFYVDFLTPDPFEALETYARHLRAATHAKPHAYDFPTVCAWYAGVWQTPGAQNHPEKSAYKLNTTPGMVEEAGEIKKCGFLNYSRAAVRLVPDNYTPDNPQGWWDDAHWQQHGFHVAPYETSRKFGEGVHRNGCLAFTYFQSVLTSEDFRKSHVEWLCGKNPGRTLDYTLPVVKEHLSKVFAAMCGHIDGVMFDYADELWWKEAVKGGFADPHATSTAYYRTLYRAAKVGLGPNSWIHERNLFQPNNDLTLGFVDLQRTTNDTDKISPELLARSELRWYKNRVVMNYDMDSKELNNGWQIDGWNGSAIDGRRMMLTMAFVASSRLLVANSFRDLSKETLHDLTRTFPYISAAKSARPIDAFACEGYPRVYDFEVNPRWHQLTLHNNAIPTRPEKIAVPLSGDRVSGAMGLDAAKEYYFYDFWNDRFSGRIKGDSSLVQELRPGEARMIAVHEVEPNPQFLATDRHLMQGYLDFAAYPTWDAKTKTLSGSSRVVADESYRVILATNDYRLREASVTSKNAQAKIALSDADNGLATLTLDAAENAIVEWSVSFDKQ